MPTDIFSKPFDLKNPQDLEFLNKDFIKDWRHRQLPTKPNQPAKLKEWIEERDRIDDLNWRNNRLLIWVLKGLPNGHKMRTDVLSALETFSHDAKRSY